MACAAETIACSPLPHSRFTVKAGVSTGSPPLMAATRLKYMSRTSVWMTLPKTAWPISDGSRPARPTASLTTWAARSHGGTVDRPPPNLPMAVRTADRTTTFRASGMSLSLHVEAAVDGPDLASDVGGFVRRQEADHAGNLLWPAQAADRNLAQNPVEHLVWDGQ